MSKIACNGLNLAVSSDKVYIFSLKADELVEDALDFRADINLKLMKSDKPLADCVQFSPCGNFVAVCIQKELLIYSNSSYKLLCSAPIEKTATCLLFFHKSKELMVADRSGCASFYTYGSDSLIKKPICLGHNSMLTDALISPDDKFVITADRDEKIRVSHYPNVYNIQSYCLGHDQFVSSLNFLPSDSSILVSVSGDGTLRLWDYISGSELLVFRDTTKKEAVPFVKSVAVKDSTGDLVAVQKYKTNEILLLSITGDKSLGFVTSVKSRISTVSPVVDLGLLESTVIYLINGDLQDLSSHQSKNHLPEGFVSKLSKGLSSVTIHESIDTFETLFKKEFDNVQEYHARKKARLEQKQLC